MSTDHSRRDQFGPRRSSPSQANTARVYNCLLDGQYNYPVDKAAADEMIRIFPLVPALARHNHNWVERATTFLIGEGVRQFLDIGSGIPDRGNLYDVVQRFAPTSKVVCVDYERVAYDLAVEIFEGNEHGHVAAIHADMRDPESVLNDPETRRVLDFSEPVAMVWGSMLHFIEDEDKPYDIFAAYKRHLCPGSYLALSHVTEDFVSGDAQTTVREFVAKYNELVSSVLTLRPTTKIADFFEGADLLPPGLVPLPDWHPEFPGYEPDVTDASRGVLVGGVGRVR